MPPIIVARTIEMVVQAVNNNGSEEINVLHFYRDAGPIALHHLTDLAAAWAASVLSPWLAVHDTGYVLNSLRLVSLESPSGPFYDYVFPANTRGTHGGSPTPSSNALALTLQSAFRGRSNRGRIFFGSISSTAISLDAINPSEVTSYLFVANRLITCGVPSGNFLGVMSRVNRTTVAVNSFRLETNLDTQRRRLVGRGR